MSQNIINAVLNFLLVSIPEELFLTVMTLIFLKRYDLLDVRMWRHNIRWLAIPTVSMALMINVFRYIIIIPKPYVSLLGYILMNVLMVYIIIRNSYNINKKLIFKIIMYTFLSFVLLSVAESIYIPLTLSLTGKTISFYTNNIAFNFLLALPGRIFEYTICIYILIRKNNSININILNMITKNRFLCFSFLSLIILFNLILLYFSKLIMVNNVLVNLAFLERLLVVIIVVSLPTLTIAWFLLIVNYIFTKEKQIQQTYENLIIEDDVVADVDNEL